MLIPLSLSARFLDDVFFFCLLFVIQTCILLLLLFFKKSNENIKSSILHSHNDKTVLCLYLYRRLNTEELQINQKFQTLLTGSA